MKELEGTKTQANLLAAFAGECMARTKYDFYGDKAKKDGFEQIAALFYQTADNERAHAKIWFKLLHGELRHTSENLFDSAEGEYAEWADMYKAFAIAAKEEGFDYFTTTLTVSPLKNASLLNEVGKECEEKYGISFLPSDFKKKNGYLRSIKLSKEYNLYRQNYCGCVFSRAKLPEKI